MTVNAHNKHTDLFHLNTGMEVYITADDCDMMLIALHCIIVTQDIKNYIHLQKFALLK